MTRPNMTRQDVETSVRQSLDDRIREGVKALLEQILEEEMTEQLGRGHGSERTNDAVNAMDTISVT